MKLLRLFLITIVIQITISAQGFTIGNNAVFSLGSATISLSNNFENNGTFNPQDGTIAFTGPSGNQTYTDISGVELNNLIVNKTSDDVLLANDITVNGTLTCTSGDLNLNGKVIYLGPTASLSETAGSTVKGTTGHIEATRDLNAPNILNVAGLGIVFTSTANLGTTKIIRKHSSQPTNTSGSILRYYDVSPTNNTGLNATITIYYDTDEINGLTEADLQLFNSTNSGSSWLRQGGVLDQPSRKVTLTNINSFSFWTLANNESCSISNAGGMIGCSKGSSVEIFSSIFITDPDDENSAGAVIQITNNYIDTEDHLSFTNKNGITGSWNSAAGQLTLTGIANKDAYVDAIRSVAYGVSSTNATESIRTFSLTVNDGSNNSNTLTKEVSVTKSNLSPYLSVNNGANVIEGGVLVLNDANLRASDPDNTSYSITYNVVEEPKHGELSFNNSLLKTGSSFSFTQNDIANGKLIYKNDGSEDSRDYFVFYLSDEDGSKSNNFTFSIAINGTNDPPVAEEPENIIMKEDQPYLLGLSYWYDCVSDPDDVDSTLTFYLSCTNSNISITSVCDTLYEITSAENFFGSDTVTVTFKDPSKDSCSVSAYIIIESVNDLPEFVEFPQSMEVTRKNVTSIEINNYVHDLESPDSLLTFSFEVEADSIFTSYNSETGFMNILPLGSFIGETNLTITVTDGDGGISSLTTSLIVLESVTSNENTDELPSEFVLYYNYPNPFNPTTKIRYGIPALQQGQSEALVQVKIYDILGKEVATLVNEEQKAGYYEYTWNAGNNASGIYFYQLTAKSTERSFRQIKKMLLVK